MIIAEVVRSGFVESVHHGSVAVLGGTGRGDVTSPIFPRSSNNRCRPSACCAPAWSRGTTPTWP